MSASAAGAVEASVSEAAVSVFAVLPQAQRARTIAIIIMVAMVLFICFSSKYKFICLAVLGCEHPGQLFVLYKRKRQLGSKRYDNGSKEKEAYIGNRLLCDLVEWHLSRKTRRHI